MKFSLKCSRVYQEFSTTSFAMVSNQRDMSSSQLRLRLLPSPGGHQESKVKIGGMIAS